MPEKLGKVQRIAFTLTPEQAIEASRLDAEGLSQAERGKHFGVSQATMSRAERVAREAGLLPISNGTPHPPEDPPTDHPRNVTAHPSAPESAPSMSPQRLELVGEPVSVEDSAPERTSALLTDHETRLAVLESFMSSLQQQAHRSAPKRTSAPVWIKRGTHLATDMAEALKDYAATHRLEVREVHDMALREFFARHNAEEGE